jgi:hypothetical protein
MKPKQKDKRKLLLVLPLLILPFLALIFYALGGGKEERKANSIKGINVDLPDAAFKEEDPENKLGFYQLADKDSSDTKNGIEDVAERLGFQSLDTDPNATQIHQKLDQINREINSPTQSYNSNSRFTQTSNMKGDVDRLEALMKAMQDNQTEDSEMQQLSGMLQNILDIQHPERVQERYEKKLRTHSDSLFRAIPAIIAENQKAIDGATIKLQLLDTILLKELLIPKGHLVYGTCRIINQRLLVDITNIRLGSSIIPVDLKIYDLDGMVGIEAPEALLTDAINNGAGDAMRNIQFMGFDQSMGAQIAGAGINAAKSLFNRRVKTIKVKLRAGYKVLLRNNQLKVR